MMVPEYLHGDVWSVTLIDGGVDYYPAADFSLANIAAMYTHDKDIVSVERLSKKVMARLSAPGYLDCTEWEMCDTLDEAREMIEVCYEVDADTGASLDEATDD